MSIFAKATQAAVPKTNYSRLISLMYAVVLVVFSLAQLYTFDEFVEYFSLLHLPLGDRTVLFLAPCIVVSEVLALPFLLRMRSSLAFRWLSMMLGWVVAIFWLTLSLWVVLASSDVDSIAFLGGVARLTPGWWAVCFSTVLIIMSAWSSWGLWPRTRALSKK